MRFTNTVERVDGGEALFAVPDETPSFPVFRRSTAAVSVVIVPGLRNSGPAHWQSHWHASLPDARRIVQRDWDTPDLDAWGEAIGRALEGVVRPIVVAHSFGCFAALAAAESGANISAALLVAPADVGLLSADSRVPRRRLSFPTTLVASTNDPWMKLMRAGELASVWGSRFVPYRDAGHINAESGFGPWPEGLLLLDELARAADQQNIAQRPVLPRSN
jgi:uncharacterized protein